MKRSPLVCVVLGLMVLPEPVTSVVGIGVACIGWFLHNRRSVSPAPLVCQGQTDDTGGLVVPPYPTVGESVVAS